MRKSRRAGKAKIEAKRAEVKGLFDQLAQGISEIQQTEGWTRWLSFQSKLYRYSFSNTRLIYAQRPTASVVMGYKGLGAIASALTGSVTNDVLHGSKRPVTLVP